MNREREVRGNHLILVVKRPRIYRRQQK
jgi:hypothetical protein